MNNTIKVILNDEKTIVELAKDPDVLVRIKDAIIDGVSRRVAKTIGSELEDRVRSSIQRRSPTSPIRTTTYLQSQCSSLTPSSIRNS